MSYRKARVYRCMFCGEEEPGIGTALPFGWSGSKRMFGECVCRECRIAMTAVKVRIEKDDDREGL